MAAQLTAQLERLLGRVEPTLTAAREREREERQRGWECSNGGQIGGCAICLESDFVHVNVRVDELCIGSQ